MKSSAYLTATILLLAFSTPIVVAQPVIVIDPQMYESELMTGELEVFILDIANDGEDPLIWMLEIEFIMAPEGWDGEPLWLMADPWAGVVPPGDCQDVIIALDATGAPGGIYEAEVHFFSNDPENPDLVAGVMLHVTPAPDIEAVWSEVAGFPNIMDYNRLGFVWAGLANEFPFTIRNTGADDLNVDAIECSDGHFTADPEEFVIAPGEEHEIVLSFETAEVGEFEGELTIFSNDPDESEFVIPVRAEAFDPPRMVVPEDSLEVGVEGEDGRAELPIANNGGYVLSWWALLNQIEGPPIDTNLTQVWLDPAAGQLSPGAEQTLAMVADIRLEGRFNLLFDLVIESNDPLTRKVVIPVSVSGENPFSVTGEAPPAAFAISNVYPNPFNSTAVIEFTLPSSEEIRLQLIDATGRTRWSFDAGMLAQGRHSFSLDARGQAPGAYVLRLEAGDQAATRRIVLVK